jgi:pantoate--beta-alanine ligase
LSDAALIRSIEELRSRRADLTGPTGLVPTMGALHAGHAALIETARRDSASVIVSIFVNPLQFDRADDLQRYPRTLTADLAMCSRLGVDIVFAPEASEVYPQQPACTVDVGRLADHLCGPFRPGHFRGVATVVMKLFQITQPDHAYFGEKDAQQLAIVRRLVSDFNVPTTIVGVSTIREPDGLALSSRNVHLTGAERSIAPILYRMLSEARRLVGTGVSVTNEIRAAIVKLMPSIPGVRLEYFEVVDPDDLQPADFIKGPVLIAGALWVGATRLIDNVLCVPPTRQG